MSKLQIIDADGHLAELPDASLLLLGCLDPAVPLGPLNRDHRLGALGAHDGVTHSTGSLATQRVAHQLPASGEPDSDLVLIARAMNRDLLVTPVSHVFAKL